MQPNTAAPAAPFLYYIDTDHLNTPRSITDQSQQLRWTWRSDPFGTTLANENPAGLGIFAMNLRFPGQFFDKETGNHYNYFRDYNPSVGRYVESDPIGLKGGLNTYAYVRNNSITRADKLGLADLIYKPGSIQIIGSNGQVHGPYPASNNASSTSGGPFSPGTYPFSHYMPHPEGWSDGPYGVNGNFVFDVPNRTGMGVHSGREVSCDLAGRCGYEHATEGCIRTTDEATGMIKQLHEGGDPIQSLKVFP